MKVSFGRTFSEPGAEAGSSTVSEKRIKSRRVLYISGWVWVRRGIYSPKMLFAKLDAVRYDLCI